MVHGDVSWFEIVYQLNNMLCLHTACFYTHSVATGVKHFKAGEHGKAMKYFDHALDIDSENVEGLVARGAL